MKRMLPGISNAFVESHSEPDDSIGTLLWIGDRSLSIYSDAFQFCETGVAQIAFRQDLRSALERPALGVQLILWCVVNDSVADQSRFRKLKKLHSQANALLLLGPLCAGQRPHPSTIHSAPAIYWHEWEAWLPDQLIRCGFRPPDPKRPKFVAIVSSSAENAGALMQVASGAKIPSVWCLPDQLRRVSGVDQVWWDDSVVNSGNVASLRDRIVAGGHRRAEHIWLAGNLTPQMKRIALENGVSRVVGKPGQVSQLVTPVGQAHRVFSRDAA